MPIEKGIINIPEIELTKFTEKDSIELHCRYTGEVFCPHCRGNELRKKDKFIRKVKHESIGTRLTHLHLTSFKYHCKSCKKYFNQRFPGVLPRRRSTELFRKEVTDKHTNDGTCLNKLSKRLKISSATIERWTRDFLKQGVKERLKYDCPTVLGIDEHFFTRKHGYATTFCDLKNHKIYDVALGRSDSTLGPYLRRLKGREKVKVVCIDLAPSYRSMVKRYFPNALIVADRFHVIRLINQYLLNYWKEVDEEGRKNRGLLSLMRRKRSNLNEDQRNNLDLYLNLHPGLKATYFFKTKLCKLLNAKQVPRKYTWSFIKTFLRYIKEMKDTPFKSLGQTLYKWRNEIARMWRFSKNNGITEGFHNKMEMITRRAYGFRNFENYRLRVRALCS